MNRNIFNNNLEILVSEVGKRNRGFPHRIEDALQLCFESFTFNEVRVDRKTNELYADKSICWQYVRKNIDLLENICKCRTNSEMSVLFNNFY